ncbi:MAG: L-asparaginase [Gammaproteobacteria bacterium HGW-Gammaproteobacteria-3]|nr:MAG: L-asparaginase [Gammaproteobacteria bacterium HGW-Gammaproteobacteria-3]
MKKILVVFTGGTIGSENTTGVIDTCSGHPFKLLDLYRMQYRQEQEIQFKSCQPLQLLSENLHPSAWERLIAAIESERPEQYSGVIVTHGTDTLAYTAAALAFYFHQLNPPMLLVASDYPLDHPKANGLDNFACAVEFIRQLGSPGVYVPYRNQRQLMQVHRGTRLASSLQLSGDFFSVQCRHAMAFADNRFKQLDAVNTLDAPPLQAALKPVFSRRILMIRPCPGLDYSRFDLTGVAAVCHDLYHAGTACATRQWGDEHSLPAFLTRCREQNIKVYLAPAIKTASVYQSTQELLAAGAHMIWNMSLEAAYVKLLLAYGNFTDDEQLTIFLESTIAGEHV